MARILIYLMDQWTMVSVGVTQAVQTMDCATMYEPL